MKLVLILHLLLPVASCSDDLHLHLNLGKDWDTGPLNQDTGGYNWEQTDTGGYDWEETDLVGGQE